MLALTENPMLMVMLKNADADVKADAYGQVDSQPGFLHPPWSSLVAGYSQLTKVKIMKFL